MQANADTSVRHLSRVVRLRHQFGFLKENEIKFYLFRKKENAYKTSYSPEYFFPVTVQFIACIRTQVYFEFLFLSDLGKFSFYTTRTIYFLKTC